MHTLICSQCKREFSLEKIYRNGRTTCSRECRTTLRKKTTIKKYGVENISQVTAIKDKKTQSFLAHYGSLHFFQTSEFKDKMICHAIDQYGVSHHSKSSVVKDKKKETMLLRYGVENPSQHSLFRDRRIDTHIARHGVTHSAYIGKSPESIEILVDFEKLKELNLIMSLSDIAREYKISYQSLSYKFIQNNVKPIRHKCSLLEQDIRNYISSIYSGNIEFGNRSVLNGKEIDIFLPELSIGIECNGAYWHGELRGRQKYYHLSKITLAESKGIRLMHIWDHEWVMQQNLIKDMLHNILTSLPKKDIPFPAVTLRDKRLAYERLGRIISKTTEPTCLYIHGYLELSITEVVGADRVWNCGHDEWVIDNSDK